MKWVHYSIDDAHKILNVNQVTHFWCNYNGVMNFPHRISYQLITKTEERVLYYGNTREDRDAAFDMLMEFIGNDKLVLHLPKIVHASKVVPKEAKRTLEVV